MNFTLEDLPRLSLLCTATFKGITDKEIISLMLIDRMFATKAQMKIFDTGAVGQAAKAVCRNQMVSGSSSQFDYLWEVGAFVFMKEQRNTPTST